MRRNVGIRNFNLKNGTNPVVTFQRVTMVGTCAAFGCTNSRKNSPGLSFHRIPAANTENKSLRQRWIQNIHRADPSCQRMKTFMFVRTISKKIGSNETLRCNFVSAYLTCILEPVHQP